MHSRAARCRVGIAAAVLAVAVPVHARGFLFRHADTGRWTKLASVNDALPVTSALAGTAFESFPSSGRAPLTTVPAGVCAPDATTLATFSARTGKPSKNTGIFLFEGATSNLYDVAIEGEATPLSGKWESFYGNNPEIVIDTDTCVVHVVFCAEISGGQPANKDSGIFDATFALPGLTPGGVSVLAQEGVTTPGTPFPSTAVLAALNPKLSVSAADSPGVGIVVVFPATVVGDGVISGTDDSGIVALSPADFGIMTVLRQGDPGCVPPWTGAGGVYDRFTYRTPVSVAASSGPTVLVEARSSGGSSATDQAIILNVGGCSGSTTVLAAESSAAPDSSTYSKFFGYRLKVNASADAAFMAGLIYPNPLLPTTTALVRSSVGIVTRDDRTGASGFGPTFKIDYRGLDLNEGSDVTFSAGVSASSNGFSSAVFVSDASAPPLQLIAPEASNPQLDDYGNMTAQFR